MFQLSTIITFTATISKKAKVLEPEKKKRKNMKDFIARAVK